MVNKVRIIAGKWRGRKIKFPDSVELRPTHDRIRETLFNWLAPHTEGAVCLDLFAGSGALGFEALSRGAAKVVFVDSDKEVVEALQENAAMLEAQNCDINLGKFPDDLPHFSPQMFDIVFLDPPYRKNYVQAAADWLEKHNCLKPNAMIYIECEKELKSVPVPSSWQLKRQKFTSSLQYCLYVKE